MGRLDSIKRTRAEVADADLIVTTDGKVLKCRYCSPVQFERVMILDPETDFVKA